MSSPQQDGLAQLIVRAREVIQAGGSQEEVLVAMRALSTNPFDALKALREIYRFSLADAKVVLARSSAWADLRGDHEAIEKAADAALGDSIPPPTDSTGGRSA